MSDRNLYLLMKQGKYGTPSVHWRDNRLINHIFRNDHIVFFKQLINACPERNLNGSVCVNIVRFHNQVFREIVKQCQELIKKD